MVERIIEKRIVWICVAPVDSVKREIDSLGIAQNQYFSLSFLFLTLIGQLVSMISSLKKCGVASLIVLVAVWLSSLQSWSPAEAVRSPIFDQIRTSTLVMPSSGGKLEQGSGGRFGEAPAFRNGKQCVNSRTRSDPLGVCDVNSVHIAMTLDEKYLRGSMAAIFSALKHSACPENVIFHFTVSDKDVELESLVQITFPFLRFKLYHFDEELVRTRISSSVRSALEQPLNYARNYLTDMLEPCVERVIYLDSDVIVVDEIAKLWDISLGPHAIGAPEYCHANFTKYFTDAFWEDPVLSSTFQDREPCYFNTGVMVMDLAKWREQNYTRKIELWMDIQKETRIYDLGSLPPFLLLFAGNVQPIEHRWNQHGLGGDNYEGRCRHLHPGPVSLLHWSGKGKPWLRLDDRTPCPIDSLWAPYDLFVTASFAFE